MHPVKAVGAKAGQQQILLGEVVHRVLPVEVLPVVHDGGQQRDARRAAKEKCGGVVLIGKRLFAGEGQLPCGVQQQPQAAGADGPQQQHQQGAAVGGDGAAQQDGRQQRHAAQQPPHPGGQSLQTMKGHGDPLGYQKMGRGCGP